MAICRGGGMGSFQFLFQAIPDLNAYNNIAIRFYQEEAKSTLLSTLVVTGFKVSNETVNTSVGGEGAEEFSFTADNMTFTGTGVDPSGS